MASAGADVPTVLRKAGLPRSRFLDVRPRFTTEELFALWRVLEEVGPRDVGLRIDGERDPREYDVSSLATGSLIRSRQFCMRRRSAVR